MSKTLCRINFKDGNTAIKSTAVRNDSFRGTFTKRVSFVSHLLLLSLRISFTTSASTVLAVASRFSKPPLNNGGSTRWESGLVSVLASLRNG